MALRLNPRSPMSENASVTTDPAAPVADPKRFKAVSVPAHVIEALS